MRYMIYVFLMLFVYSVSADVLFQDDFESGKIDSAKWTPQVSWKVQDNTDKHAVLGQHVLDILGGEVGLSTDEFPEEFDYYADFKTVGNGLTGFVFHGQDGNNIYMHQVSTATSAHTPQHIRWHRRIASVWGVEPGAFEDKKDREENVWYRVKFEVRKNYKFKAFLGDVGAEDKELTLVSEWTDSQSSFEKGKIGFRMAGSEHAQYDNIVVATPGFDVFNVESKNKLAEMWGNIKRLR